MWKGGKENFVFEQWNIDTAGGLETENRDRHCLFSSSCQCSCSILSLAKESDAGKEASSQLLNEIINKLVTKEAVVRAWTQIGKRHAAAMCVRAIGLINIVVTTVVQGNNQPTFCTEQFVFSHL